MALTRRSLLVAAAVGFVGTPARASEFSYRDWHFDTDDVKGELTDEIVRSFQAQIDIVESLAIKPEIKSFFRGADVRIQRLSESTGWYIAPGERKFGTDGLRNQMGGGGGFRGVVLSSVRPIPPANPFFLQLLLYGYLNERMPGGRRNEMVGHFVDEARQSGSFPNNAAMLNNPRDFFAICTSVVLWGRANREPLTRQRIHDKLPRFYDWIVKEFTPDGIL